MNSGSPAGTGATDSSYIRTVAAYSDLRCSVKPRLQWSRTHPAAPSGSVHWGLPNHQKASTGCRSADPGQAGCTAVGQQWERRSPDQRSRCGADQPGLAAKRRSASDDAYAIHDQCERRNSPRTDSVLCRPVTRPMWHLGSRGEWLTLRAVGKRTFTSSPNVFLQ